MTERCADLVSFVDGELEPERADAFRDHLRTCAVCPAALVEAMQLSARLEALSPAPARVAPPPARADKRWARAALVGLPVAAVALLVLCRPTSVVAPVAAVTVRGVVSDALAEITAERVFAAAPTRPYEIRLALAGASRFRPMTESIRGGRDAAARNPVGYDVLDALERRGDLHALAIAKAWNHEDRDNVIRDLEKLEQTPAVLNDRVAIESLGMTEDNLEPALAELDRLRTSADVSARSAARWNYALLLLRLKLPRTAAREFRAIAGEHEQGWSDEARRHASDAEHQANDTQARWEAAFQAGEALVKTGTPVPAASLRAVPSMMRGYLYNAVRSAPTRERVLALVPMAIELDRPSGDHLLADYVRRIAGVDFRRRAALADAYARLLRHEPITPEERRQLTTPAPSLEVVDIVVGALNELDLVAGNAAAFARMARTLGDPWFDVVRAKAEADAEVARGHWRAAEGHLLAGQAICRDHDDLIYQCLGLALSLARLYQHAHHVPEALAVMRPAVSAAHSAQEWGRVRQLLVVLADLERFNGSAASARAFANEVLLMTAEPCERNAVVANLVLVGAAILDVDGPAARKPFEAAAACQQHDLAMANHLADIARLDPRAGDLARLQGWLREFRTGPGVTGEQRVLADEIEGRLLIESDRAAGVALLERAIDGAAARPEDVEAGKARAGAYSVLVLDAARKREHAHALELLARQLGRPVPGPCVVGMAAEDERAAVIVRGPDGQDHAAYEATRGRSASPPAVPDRLARELSGCAHVQVIALAALQGAPRVLPPAFSWSYATGIGHPGKPEQAPRTVIVRSVTPPATLKLAALLDEGREPDPAVELLSGAEATPQRVLAEIRDASEIQFHTHALRDVGLSDASYLALSPEPGGSYALTAEAIRGTELRGHPVVVLAACQAARGARYQHAPWSLPHAFLAAGASAVFAAATDIPDRAAGPFFDRVLARVRGGADPATALRDERMAIVATTPTSWVADVVLFE